VLPFGPAVDLAGTMLHLLVVASECSICKVPRCPPLCALLHHNNRITCFLLTFSDAAGSVQLALASGSGCAAVKCHQFGRVVVE
jgi:hypothetical protein